MNYDFVEIYSTSNFKNRFVDLCHALPCPVLLIKRGICGTKMEGSICVNITMGDYIAQQRKGAFAVNRTLRDDVAQQRKGAFAVVVFF